MASPYLETEIDISTFLNRGRLPDLYLKINLFEKYLATISLRKKTISVSRTNVHRVVMIRVTFEKTGTRRVGRKNRFHGEEEEEDIGTEERKKGRKEDRSFRRL